MKTEEPVFTSGALAGALYAIPKFKDNQLLSYRLHKQFGQAIVTLGGREHLLPRQL